MTSLLRACLLLLIGSLVWAGDAGIGVAIPTSLPPSGTASGDLSGSYPSPTVAKVNGVALGTISATAGQFLLANGTTITSQALTGDVSVTGNALSTVLAINGATLGTTTPTAGNVLIGSGTTWVTQAFSGAATLGSTGTVTLGGGDTTRHQIGLGTADSPSFTGLTDSGLTATRLVVAGTGGALTGYSSLTSDASGDLTATTMKITTPFAEYQMFETSNGNAFRWTLNNDGSCRLAASTNGFTSVSANPIYTTTAGRVCMNSVTDDGVHWLQVTGSVHGVSLGTIGTAFEGNIIAGRENGASDTAGSIGETITGTASAVALASTTQPGTLTSVALTAGKWQIAGWVTFDEGATGFTAGSNVNLSIVTTTNTNGTEGTTMTQDTIQVLEASGKKSMSIPMVIVNNSGSQTYYLTAQAAYAAGSPTASGLLTAVRLP